MIIKSDRSCVFKYRGIKDAVSGSPDLTTVEVLFQKAANNLVRIYPIFYYFEELMFAMESS